MELAAVGGWIIWILKGLSIVFILLLLLALTLLYFYQNLFIYASEFPQGARTEIPKPNEHQIADWEDVTITTSDNVKIKAYLIKSRTGNKTGPLSNTTILYFHGQAGNIGHRLPIAKALQMYLTCNVLMVSYRGYGASEGSANEKGLRLDGEAAMEYILEHQHLKKSKIIVYGQSLGGAVALHVASKNQGKIHALMIENTFLSVPKVLPNAVPLLAPLTFLCSSVWDSEKLIGSIDLPILFLSGDSDQIVPNSHMKKLHDISKNSTKKLIKFKSFAKGNHNDTVSQPAYFETVRMFLNEVDKAKTTKK
ncbi:Alpha/Beta hydrolase protein [Globomyces pollinis-pini]|nr:Alpha/Beta hydrolase protein [Globomyces pollinis-pini]